MCFGNGAKNLIKKCIKMMNIDIRFTVGLILFDRSRDRYLILRRNPERYRGWGLIKGGIDEGETPQQACLRETAEEIGIALSEEILKNLEHTSAYYDNTKKKIVLVYWFAAEVSEFDPLTLEQEEWVDYRWATYDEAQYELVWQSQQRALKIAHMWLISNEQFKDESED